MKPTQDPGRLPTVFTRHRQDQWSRRVEGPGVGDNVTLRQLGQGRHVEPGCLRQHPRRLRDRDGSCTFGGGVATTTTTAAPTTTAAHDHRRRGAGRGRHPRLHRLTAGGWRRPRSVRTGRPRSMTTRVVDRGRRHVRHRDVSGRRLARSVGATGADGAGPPPPWASDLGCPRSSATTRSGGDEPGAPVLADQRPAHGGRALAHHPQPVVLGPAAPVGVGQPTGQPDRGQRAGLQDEAPAGADQHHGRLHVVDVVDRPGLQRPPPPARPGAGGPAAPGRRRGRAVRPPARRPALGQVDPAVPPFRPVVRRRLPAHRPHRSPQEPVDPRHRPEPALRPDRGGGRHPAQRPGRAPEEPVHRRPRVPALLLRRRPGGEARVRRAGPHRARPGPEGAGARGHPRRPPAHVLRLGDPAGQHPLRLLDDQHPVPARAQPVGRRPGPRACRGPGLGRRAALPDGARHADRAAAQGGGAGLHQPHHALRREAVRRTGDGRGSVLVPRELDVDRVRPAVPVAHPGAHRGDRGRGAVADGRPALEQRGGDGRPPARAVQRSRGPAGPRHLDPQHRPVPDGPGAQCDRHRARQPAGQLQRLPGRRELPAPRILRRPVVGPGGPGGPGRLLRQHRRRRALRGAVRRGPPPGLGRAHADGDDGGRRRLLPGPDQPAAGQGHLRRADLLEGGHGRHRRHQPAGRHRPRCGDGAPVGEVTFTRIGWTP